MGARGPAPIPTQLKVLRGNPGHQKLNRQEPKPAPIVPNCPSWLTRAAKREWRRIVPVLDAIGLLTQADMSALAGYCQSYARWVEAEEEITRLGLIVETGELVEPEEGFVKAKGYRTVKANPAVAISQKERQIMLSFGARLGLSPSDRGRMTLPDAQSEEESPFD